jgi:RluA family pseudouridine synthase
VSFTFLAERPGFVAINKPAGISVIPGRDGSPDCVRTRLEAQLGRPVWVVHRLDRDTSGVMLFALDAPSHRTLSMAFEKGEIHKRYLALVEGRLETELLLDQPLTEARKSRMRIARAGEEGKVARTQVRPRTLFAKTTWVEAEPLTGRTHQIRVHLLAAGHPLVFDHQYGRKTPLTARDLGADSDRVVLARTPLHAERIEVEGVAYEAPVPDDIAAALELLSK